MSISDDDYNAGLCQAYEGEVFGEAFWSSMAANVEDYELRSKFDALTLLERETGTRLRPLVEKLDIFIDKTSLLQDKGAREGDAMVKIPWAELLPQIKSEFERSLRWSEQLLSMAPNSDKKLLSFYIQHQKALLDFADRKMYGDKRSLDSVHTLVNGISY